MQKQVQNIKTEEIKFYEELKKIEVSFLGNKYYKIVDLCNMLKLTNNTKKNISKKIWTERFKYRSEKFKLKTHNNNGVVQHRTYVCIPIDMLKLYLMSYNVYTLSEEQFTIYTKMINYIGLNSTGNIKCNKVYSYEKDIRDEIYKIGYFNDIKIEELEYKLDDFNRVDLIGRDSNGSLCGIELKKYSNSTNTINQLARYKQFKLDRLLYIAYEISEELKEWCNENNVECYQYRRELKFYKA